jgi:hypothetical protein
LWNNLHQVRRVWRYQRINQNPYIEEEQTTQWQKEKVQKDKQGKETLLTWWRLFHKHVVVPEIKYLHFLLSTNMNHAITRLLTCVTRRTTLVVRGLLTIAAHMSSLAVFVGG